MHGKWFRLKQPCAQEPVITVLRRFVRPSTAFGTRAKKKKKKYTPHAKKKKAEKTIVLAMYVYTLYVCSPMNMLSIFSKTQVAKIQYEVVVQNKGYLASVGLDNSCFLRKRF